MTERITHQPNKNNLSRIGDTDNTYSVTGTKDSHSLEYYIIVEGKFTEQYYIRHLKNAQKLNFNIKSYGADKEFTKEEPWAIRNGIKCLEGGDYFNKINSIDGLYRGIENTTGARPHIICIFDLDKCTEKKKQSEDFFKTYKNDIIPIARRNDNIILCVSMPNIEYWFLSHYDDDLFDNDLVYDSKMLKVGLTKCLKGTFYSKSENFLNSPRCIKWFNELCNDQRLQIAKEHAIAKANNPKRLDKVNVNTDCNISYSDLYKLFEIE